jgi:hypothetical protein
MFYLPKVTVGLPGLLGEKLTGKSPLAACLFFCAPVGLAVVSISGR